MRSTQADAERSITLVHQLSSELVYQAQTGKLSFTPQRMSIKHAILDFGCVLQAALHIHWQPSVSIYDKRM